jgi:transcriptional regulator with GAF, ATPase, and Fis domain
MLRSQREDRSTDHESMDSGGASFMEKKKTPLLFEPRESPTSLGADFFSERILDEVTDVLMLVLRKDSGRGLSLKELLEALERDLLVQALSDCNGHQISAARFLHLKPTTLCAKLKRFRIKAEFKRADQAHGLRPRADDAGGFVIK